MNGYFSLDLSGTGLSRSTGRRTSSVARNAVVDPPEHRAGQYPFGIGVRHSIAAITRRHHEFGALGKAEWA